MNVEESGFVEVVVVGSGTAGSTAATAAARAGAGRNLPEGTTVGILPLGLTVGHAVNLSVAGRCCSFTHDARAFARSMARCRTMGQAAGVAAAADGGGAARAVQHSSLRDRLRREGGVLAMKGAA